MTIVVLVLWLLLAVVMVACCTSPKEHLEDETPELDIVPVIRCEKCEHWKTWGCAMDNPVVTFFPKATDFCSYGKKKEGLADGQSGIEKL